MLVLAVSCKQEKKQAYYISNLSGEYRLDYVGGDSKGLDSNLTNYCGGKYCLYLKEKNETANEYGIYSSDSAFLFDTKFKQIILIENAQGNDSIFCHQLVNTATYDPAIHTEADSLLIGDKKVKNRTVFFHADHFLIQTDTGKNNASIRYYKFER